MSQADRNLCIVVGGSIHSTLHVARTIATDGIPVWVASRQRALLAVAAASRSCEGVVCLAAADPDNLARELNALVDLASPDAESVLVVTNSDRMLDLLDRGRDQFDDRVTLAIPPRGTVSALLDKSSSLRLAERAGLEVPRWTAVGDLAEIQSLPAFDYPVCVRPTSWEATGTEHFKIAVCHDVTHLSNILRRGIEGGGRYIVQEYVGHADDLEVGMVWVPPHNTEVASWTGRKARSSSVRGGVLAYGESVVLPDVDYAVRRFAEVSDFEGVGGIEMLRSGGHLWFIEFNPRLEAFHKLASLGGFDGAGLIVREWLGRPTDSDMVAEPLPAALLVWGAWWDRLKEDPRCVGALLHDLRRLLLHRRRAFAIWSIRDPMPLFVSCRVWARAAIARRVRWRGRLRGQGPTLGPSSDGDRSTGL